MQIETQLDFKKYLSVIFLMSYKKPMMIFMTFFGVIMFVASILYLLGLYMPDGDVMLPGMVLGFFIVVVLPTMTYIGARRMYKSQPQINEQISYTFGEDGITIVGESFRSEIKWNMVYKIVEWENWVLLYQNTQGMFWRSDALVQRTGKETGRKGQTEPIRA